VRTSGEKIRKSGRGGEEEEEEDERSRTNRERKRRRRKLTSRRGAEAWMRYWLPGLHVLSG